MSRIREILHRPLFGTVVIPKEARVDPALFPDDEFPVYCGKCGYRLKGTDIGVCPECGEEYERGRRLVELYCFRLPRKWEPRMPLWRVRQWLLWIFAVSLVTGIVAFVVVLPWEGKAMVSTIQQSTVPKPLRVPISSIVGMCAHAVTALSAFALVGFIFAVAFMRPDKRRRVREAWIKSQKLS